MKRRSTPPTVKRPDPGRYKRTRVMRKVSLYSNPRAVHSFRATQFASVINGTAPGTTQFFASTFSIAGVPNSVAYTSLFDQYRINKIEVKFIQSYVNAPSAPGAVSQPVLYVVTDLDDATVPTTSGQILERQNHRILNFSGAQSVHKHSLVPGVSSYDLSTAAGSLASSVKTRPWLNCQFNNIAHNGIKYIIENLNSNAQIAVYVTYFFQMRATI